MESDARSITVAGLYLLLSAPLATQTLDEARQLHIEGDYRQALSAYAKVADDLAETDPAAAATARNNACVIHNGFGEYEAARAACEEALRLRRPLDDDRRLARTLNNLAIALQNLGEYREARDTFLEALAINTRRDDALAQVLNLSNLGALATLAGRYAEALRFHEQATALAADRPEQPWSAEQVEIATINRGVVLEHLGAYREALELYRDLVDRVSAEADPRRRAQLKLNSGVIYRNLGDPVRAAREFEEVATLFRDLEDPDGLSNALLNLGLVLHLNLERWPQAEAAYREALAISSRLGDRPEEIQDLFYLGRFLFARGRFDEAEEMYRSCLAVSRDSGSAEGRWSALAGLGRIAAARGDHNTAAEHLAAAIDEIEGVGTEIEAARLRSGFFGDKRPVYAAAAQVFAELHRLEPAAGHDDEAFEVVQRAKARALLDSLGAGQWTAEPLTVGALGGAALGGPALEYFVAERDLLRWTVGPGGVEMRNLGPHTEILSTVLDVYRQLAEGSTPEATVLGALSANLLADAGLRSTGPSTLHVAADGILRRLPFEILSLPERPQGLVTDLFAVSYVPSTSTLVWLRERRRRRFPMQPDATAVRAFADPRLPLGDNDSPIGLIAARFALAPLAAAADEVESLTRRIPGRRQIVTGQAATEAAFRAAAADEAGIVHLATHTVIDERPGRGAAVLLAPGEDHDGLLEPREIATLDQHAELTVLASCRSALASGSGGALSTLTGSFLAAGSSAVVATLWDVGDATTAAFMDQFYYQLGRGKQPALALRDAKRTLRQSPAWSQPHLWSGYVLVGDAPALAGRSITSTALIAGGALLLAAVLIATWWRRRATAA